MKKWLIDTIPMVIFTTIFAFLGEVLIIGITVNQSLVARITAIPINIVTARPYALFRDWSFTITKTKNAGQFKKAIVDIVVFTIFQTSLYLAILIWAGANAEQLLSGLIISTAACILAGRPYGIFLNFFRNFFKKYLKSKKK